MAIARFLPRSLGGQADRVDGDGVRLRVAPGNGPGLTTDPADPRLGRRSDDEPVQQNAAYLILSDEERAKGFVRPVRRTYLHTTCGSTTTMSQAIAETYARDPSFYGATFCCRCQKHRPLDEFVWDDDGSRVGS